MDLTPFGFEALPETFEEYEASVNQLVDTSNATMWGLGDLVVYGDERWHDIYTQAFPSERRKNYRTLQNYALTCRAFPYHRRKYDVSFSHYAEVRKLPERQQDELLTEAVMQDLSRDELRQRVREVKAEPEPVRVQMECKVRDIIKELCYRHGLDLSDTVRISATVLDSIMEAAA